jgi:hypothetical protein
MEIMIGLLIVAAWNIAAGVIDATDDRLGLASSRPSPRYSRRRALPEPGPTAPEPKLGREPRLIWSSALPRPLSIPAVMRLSR